MSRLTIDLTDEQHRHLKAVAALEGKTIRQFAIERLLPIEGERNEDWERFKAFMNKRIENGLAGKVSDRSFDEIVDTAFERKSAA
jgi:Antitoxin ParD